MQTIKIEKITRETFKPYGQLIEFPVKEEPTVEVETVTFWKQQVMFNIDGGEVEVGVLKVRKHAMIFDEFENHFKTATGLISLDGDFALAVADPADEIPKTDTIKAYKFKKNQLVLMDEKCWHGVAYPIDTDEITVLVIFKKGSLDDDTVFEKLDQSCELVF